MNHVHHTHRGRREEKTFHLVGKDRLEEVKALQRASLGLRLTKRDTGRSSLEDKLTRREKDLFPAYDLIPRFKLGKEIEAGVPKKSGRKAEIQALRSAVADAEDARDAPRPLSTRDVGKEAQPPQQSTPRVAASFPAPGRAELTPECPKRLWRSNGLTCLGQPGCGRGLSSLLQGSGSLSIGHCHLPGLGPCRELQDSASCLKPASMDRGSPGGLVQGVRR